MNDQQEGLPAGYQAAISGSAYYTWENPGFLRINGDDRQTFLQRQTTNDVHLLKPSRALVTVLTNPAGRILDVLTLLDGSDHLMAITLPGQAGITHKFLRSRIFFNDKVTIDNISHEIALINLLGAGSADLLGQLGVKPAPAEDQVVSWGTPGSLVQGFSRHSLGYRLVCPANQLPVRLAALEREGAHRMSYETIDLLRIEAGIPAAGQELTDEYTPLETGLDWAISASKGCYTGQEVIARQLTYDKVTRHLVGLRLNQPTQTGEAVYSPGEDRQVGRITSAAVSPRLGAIALAILRRPYDQPGSQVTLSQPDGLVAAVGSLPF